MERPFPPAELLDDGAAYFMPSVDLHVWTRGTFLDFGSSVYNADHRHLSEAGILWLWTNVAAKRHGNAILGEAALLQHGQTRWNKALPNAVATRWFEEMTGAGGGSPPDFQITLYAPWCAQAGDAEFMQLVEHELYHCAQATNAYGFPKTTQSGEPVWAIKGHDVEAHLGEIRRYGALSPAVVEMVRLAGRRPEVAPVNIAAACGTCKAA